MSSKVENEAELHHRAKVLTEDVRSVNNDTFERAIYASHRVPGDYLVTESDTTKFTTSAASKIGTKIESPKINDSPTLHELIWRDSAERMKEDVLHQLDVLLTSGLDTMMSRATTSRQVLLADHVDGSQTQIHTLPSSGHPLPDNYVPPRSNLPPEKQFYLRDSILTDLFRVSHIRSVYHIFVAIMIIFFLNTTINDFLEKGGMFHTYHFELFFWVFGGARDVLCAWFLMQTTALLLPYIGFSGWVILREQTICRSTEVSNDHADSVRQPQQADSKKTNLDSAKTFFPSRVIRWDFIRTTYVDYLGLLFYATYQVLFFMITLLYVLYMDLPPASSCIVVAEQVRMIMKAHAFVRVNAAKTIYGNEENNKDDDRDQTSSTEADIAIDKQQPQPQRNRFCPSGWTSKSNYNSSSRRDSSSTNQEVRKRKRSEGPETVDDEEDAEVLQVPWRPYFSHYLYFMFAPTLVYKEKYPRTSRIHWHYVASNFAQVLACVVYAYYIFSRFCFQPFAHYGRSEHFHLSMRKLVLSGFNLTLPGGLLLLLTFFSFLHCWLNAFAEMLRFGDRLFYKDWWNSTGFSGWYRTWNVVVHDWLYMYIYRDLWLALGRGKKAKMIAACVVFLTSAFVHEYILTMVFRFFYPVLFLFFGGFGFLFFFIRGKSRGWNVILWVQLFIGMGQIICLYSTEWYARRNCEPIFHSWLDFWIPHSWFCTRRLAATTQGTVAVLNGQ